MDKKPLILWRTYYADGRTYDNNDGPPAGAPGAGVQAIAQSDESCRWICRSGDFYLFDLHLYGGWAGVDIFGLAQYITRPGLKIIKMGETTDNETFREILSRASADIGHKSAWRKEERRPDDP